MQLIKFNLNWKNVSVKINILLKFLIWNTIFTIRNYFLYQNKSNHHHNVKFLGSEQLVAETHPDMESVPPE